ncbi:MAG TPA: hypothetical protein VHC22_11175 [Pirellulales bacterium]|nr:hypothetical protein [Pirellulales bacterium]
MFRQTIVRPRDILLARVLHARLYVNVEGRVFVVSGQVAHDKLKQTLAHRNRCPSMAESPTPNDLGCPCVDGELSFRRLDGIGRALNAWRKDLAAEMRLRPAKRRSTARLARERQEIARLTSRLKTLRRWRAALASGREPTGAPYFLDAAAETSLRAALTHARRECPLTPLMAWQARVVYWLSGDCATRRFLSAVTRLLSACPKTSWSDRVRGFQQAVLVWKRRGEQESIRHLLVEMSLHLRRLPASAIRAGQFSARLRGRTFREHCDFLLASCTQLLEDARRGRWLVPAALAALAAADGSATALPHQCFKVPIGQEDFSGLLLALERLAAQIGKPGYDALLIAMDQLSVLPHTSEFELLCQLLGRGNSVSDALWAGEHHLMYRIASSCLSVPVVRRLSEMFAEHGYPLDWDELGELVGRIQKEEDLKPVRAWLAWLGSVSPRVITPRMRKLLDVAFWKRYLPSVHKHGWFEQLAPCLSAVRREKAPEDCQALLDRIAAQQRFIGKNEMLPKSLRKLLDLRDRRERERRALCAQRAAGTLAGVALPRLQSLERQHGASPDPAKIRRFAEEAFLQLGIESMDVVTRQLAAAACRTYLGSVAERIAPDRHWDFAAWARAVTELEGDRLRELIVARECHGPEYKRHLSENQDWLGEAAVHGVDLDRWLSAEPDTIVVGGRAMDIGLASDLHHLFLMGNYFHTCLTLGECNDFSVLGNAYDANKQVVFVFTDDDAARRQVVARQIIAVSSDFKLLGYRCYVASRFVEKGNREEIMRAMASYCGRLAARCGLELTAEGCPQSIADHFWYDDGACEWLAAARTAWAESTQMREETVVSL